MVARIVTCLASVVCRPSISVNIFFGSMILLFRVGNSCALWTRSNQRTDWSIGLLDHLHSNLGEKIALSYGKNDSVNIVSKD